MNPLLKFSYHTTILKKKKESKRSRTMILRILTLQQIFFLKFH